MTVYVLICFGLGSIFGGFDPHGEYLLGYNFTPQYLIRLVIASIFVYVSIVSFTVFIATTWRNIGPCIPIIIVLLLMLSSIVPTVTVLLNSAQDMDGLIWFMRIADPLYCVSESTIVINDETKSIEMAISNETFISGICSNVVYAALFFGFGALEFKKRDVK